MADEQPTKAGSVHQTTNLLHAIPKNINKASVINRGQQENINFITAINFAEQTMTALSKYHEQLKTQLGFNMTQQAM